MSASRNIILAGLGSLFGLGLGVAAHLAWPADPYVDGLFIGDRALPKGVSAASWLSEYQPAVAERTVFLRYGDVTREVDFATLGASIDIEATLSEAAQVAHVGSPLTRVREAHAARRGEVFVPLRFRISKPRAEQVVLAAAEAVFREPVDARLELSARKIHPDVPGVLLDQEGALAAIYAADLDQPGLLVIDLPTKLIPARVSESSVADVDVTKVLASSETKFSHYLVGRSKNVERAAELLDGVILPPGQVISFNQLVGARTLARGFHLAPEIQGDELTTGVGGGTCQVSSTLFSAAVFGALTIVERKSHSQVSSYAKMGLDATVSFPSVDLKLQNPYAYPLMIHASFPQPGTLKVELLGGQPTAQVTYTYGVARVEDFVRRITVKEYLKPGTRIRRQRGGRGYDVSSLVTIRWPGGRTEERRYYSGYRPKPEVFWVAPGYDEGELPPMPLHAKGVEGRLAESESIYGDVTTL